jgi:tetraacyldisaccharide 4'-kinase
MGVRATLYRRGWHDVQRLPLPTVAVGNLSVGGTGKTPLAAWIAARCTARGLTPGVLLRGYGGDEAAVHRRLVPGAVVVANPDRAIGAREARARGAMVLILDDAFQLLGVARDLNIALMSAETMDAPRWTLPAGPWRESLRALARADWIVVTRKCVEQAAAAALADDVASRHGGRPVAVAYLALERLEGLESGTRHAPAELAERRVLAAAGIADPGTFGAQLSALGAVVRVAAYRDHHAYSDADVRRLVRASAAADYVVVTEKDAVKLRGRWPRSAAEPLVAVQGVRWERHGRAFEQALDAALEPPAVSSP